MNTRVLVMTIGLLALLAVWDGRRPRYRTNATGWQVARARLLNALALADEPPVSEHVFLRPTYLLDEHDWLEFPLPAAARLVRVMTTASLPGSADDLVNRVTATDRWAYSIEYQLLDGEDEVLLHAPYHFRSKPIGIVEPETGHIVASRFYSSDQETPCSTRLMLLPMPAELQAATLRLRVLDKSHPISGVATRVFCQHQLPEYKLKYVWQRASVERKADICRASVYGPELLTESERLNALRFPWSPIAPTGIEGRDYVRRILYVRDANDYLMLPPTDTPAGLRISSHLHGMIPLPEDAKQVRLVPQVDPASREPRGRLVVQYFDTQGKARWVHTFHLGPELEPSFPVRGGLLQLRSDYPLVIQAWARPQGSAEETDVTPPNRTIRTYICTRNSPVEFALSHAGDRATPLRLSARAWRKLERPDDISEDAVHYEFLDETGDVLRDGHLKTAGVLSTLDRLSDAEIAVAEPATRYFLVPPGISRLRVWATHYPCLVYAATRPADLTDHTTLPEDRSLFDRWRRPRRRWFSVRPPNAGQLVDAGRTAVMFYQPRPPLQIASGQEVQWEQFFPEDSWTGRYMMITGEAHRPGTPRLTPSSALFVDLPTNHPQPLDFRGDNTSQVTPTVVLRNDNELPVAVQYRVNGQVLAESIAAPGTSQLRLPTLPSGSATVELECQGNVRCWINHVQPRRQPVYWRRLAIQFEGTARSFSIEKSSWAPETIMVRRYLPGTTPERTSLKLQLSELQRPTLRALSDWTFANRVCDVKTHHEPALLIGQGNCWLYGGEACRIRLGSDVPPGRYALTVSGTPQTEGWLLVTRTMLGSDSEPHIFREELTWNVEPEY